VPGSGERKESAGTGEPCHLGQKWGAQTHRNLFRANEYLLAQKLLVLQFLGGWESCVREIALHTHLVLQPQCQVTVCLHGSPLLRTEQRSL